LSRKDGILFFKMWEIRPLVVLKQSKESGEEVYLSVLARWSNTDKETLRKVLMRLERKGLVRTRLRNRRLEVQITPKGEKACDILLDAMEKLKRLRW